MLSYVISFLSGSIVAIFAEPVRRWIFKPKLILEFDPEKAGYIAETPEVNMQTGQIIARAHYIRVKVTNTSFVIAKECKAFLINIQKLGEDNRLIDTIYCDSIQLAWACQSPDDRFRSIDIPKGLNQFIDIFALRNTKREFDPQLYSKPFIYFDLFSETGTFILTIQLVASGTKPKQIKLKYDGNWENYSIEKYK